MDSQTVLVTGATGRIGRHLVETLADQPPIVRAMTRHPDQASDAAGLGATLVEGDFADPASLDEALIGVDRAFLLSPVLQEMATLQMNFIDAAERADLDQVVKLSAAGADPNSKWDIARWHGEVETALAESDIPHTNLRPVFYMQNLLDDHRLRQKGELARPAPPETRINMIDTRDVAAVAAMVLTTPGHTDRAYKLTGQRPVSLAEVAETFATVLDRDVAYHQIPPEVAVDQFIDQGSPEWLAREQVALFQGFAKGAGDVDTDAVATLLDRQPRSLRKFASDYTGVFTPGN